MSPSAPNRERTPPGVDGEGGEIAVAVALMQLAGDVDVGEFGGGVGVEGAPVPIEIEVVEVELGGAGVEHGGDVDDARVVGLEDAREEE